MAAKNSKTLIIGGVAVVALAGAWLGLNALASGKAEDKLQKVVRDYNLGQYVRWDEVSASFLGSAHIKGLTISFPGTEPVYIKSVALHEAENTDKRTRLKLSLEEVSNENVGKRLLNYQGVSDAVVESGAYRLPPPSLELDLDADKSRNEASIKLKFDLPKVSKGELQANLIQVNGVLSLLSNPPAPSGGFGSTSLSSSFEQLGYFMQLLQPVAQVQLSELNYEVTDQGLMKRRSALWERYSTDMDYEQSSKPSKLRENTRAELIAFTESPDCSSSSRSAFALAQNPQKACKAIRTFVLGDGTVELSFKPQMPVPLMKMDEWRPTRWIQGSFSERDAQFVRNLRFDLR